MLKHKLIDISCEVIKKNREWNSANKKPVDKPLMEALKQIEKRVLEADEKAEKLLREGNEDGATTALAPLVWYNIAVTDVQGSAKGDDAYKLAGELRIKIRELIGTDREIYQKADEL